MTFDLMLPFKVRMKLATSIVWTMIRFFYLNELLKLFMISCFLTFSNLVLNSSLSCLCFNKTSWSSLFDSLFFPFESETFAVHRGVSWGDWEAGSKIDAPSEEGSRFYFKLTFFSHSAFFPFKPFNLLSHF